MSQAPPEVSTMTEGTPIPMPSRLPRLVLVAALAAAAGACASAGGAVPAGTLNPDRFLMDRAEAAVADNDWLEARENFQQIVDNYPQSPLREDARMGLANTFLEQGGAENMVLAAAEFQDFLRFYPTSTRADEAQYGLAMTHYEQMRSPERDQTETRAALDEFQRFFASYPNSELTEQARTAWREARDRLSESIYLVGRYYHRTRWYPGAIDRFRQILDEDPDYSGRDSVYYYLADSLARSDNPQEAIPYLERLIAEFDVSEHLADAEQRLQELSVQ